MAPVGIFLIHPSQVVHHPVRPMEKEGISAGSYRAVGYSRDLEGKWTPENKEQISTVRCRAGKVVAVALASSSASFENSSFQQQDFFFFLCNWHE